MRGFENEIFWAGFRRSKFLEKIRIPCNTIEGALGSTGWGLSIFSSWISVSCSKSGLPLVFNIMHFLQ